MAVVGRACLVLALAICAYGIGAALYSRRAPHAGWLDSARRSVYSLALVLTVAMAVLEIAFLRNDFSFTTVADTSSRSTPEAYRAAAIWASQEGSLLLWAWLLSLWSSLVLFSVRKRLRDITPYAIAILLGFAAFFVSLMVFYAEPFATVHPAYAEGTGLDPLLRFPTMMIHPPILYSGYTLAIIPLAFGMAALLARRVDAEWIRAVRRFAMASWLFLGIGILLGARWSYSELGWGGYWGWDPVENASLMPWLTATAFLHSIMIQEKRGMLKVWNASLVLATGTLAITGTFLVRSGILDSIHAFGASTLGVPFVVLIGVLVAGSIYLVVSRRDMLRSEHRLESLVCRESAFMANNLILVALCFVIFWGTFFPLISEAITGQTASVGPPWFDRYTVPLALVLVALSGIGPVIPWRRASAAAMRKHMIVPLAAAMVAGLALSSIGAAGKPLALAMFCCAAFAVTTVAGEIWRGSRARMAMAGESLPMAALSLVSRNRRRYGGYTVHVGIAVLLIGVAASSSFEHQNQVSLSPGKTTRVGSYEVRYVRPTAAVLDDPTHTGATLDLGAVLDISQHGHHVATLAPKRAYYESDEPSQGSIGQLIGGQSVSQISMDREFTGNLWSAIEPDISAASLQRVVEIGNRDIPASDGAARAVALAVLARRYLQSPPPAQFNLIVSPLVEWVWLGGLLVLAGTLISMWPARLLGRVRAIAPAALSDSSARGLARAGS